MQTSAGRCSMSHVKTHVHDNFKSSGKANMVLNRMVIFGASKGLLTLSGPLILFFIHNFTCYFVVLSCYFLAKTNTK